MFKPIYLITATEIDKNNCNDISLYLSKVIFCLHVKGLKRNEVATTSLISQKDIYGIVFTS